MKRRRVGGVRGVGSRLDCQREAHSRVGCVELLEVRRLLAIDFPATPLAPSLDSGPGSQLATPIARLFYPNGVAEPFSSSSPVGHTPAQIRQAYGFDQILFGGTVLGDGSGQTIAIIDAYHSPTIQSDLKAFDLALGIPDPPSFKQVAQNGTTNYPPVDPKGPGTNNWEVETSLDVEWSHAAAPKANILLVEATDNSFGNLIQTAANYARNQPGVSVVSMSFGSPEFTGETGLDTQFTTPGGHAGITFIASTGDDGQPGEYPAYSPNVLAVGGTTLTLDGANNITNETGWSGSGGGISLYESQPNYQTGVVTQSASQRTTPDVSFDANPSSGAAIYDSYNGGTSTPWEQIGGTSFSAPSWAGLIAVADQGRTLAGLPMLDGHNGTLPAVYSAPSSSFRDITSGNNGVAAGPGYDLVTGRGSPRANLIVNNLIGASSVSGTVFSDDDADGVQDGSEGGLGGWIVYDDVNGDGVFDPASQTTINSTDTPITIPGSSTITSSLAVSGFSGPISDVNVNLSITQSRDTNLVVTLIAPDGTSIPLVSHSGGSGNNFVNTTFDDQASTAITSGMAPFTGTFRPANPLATLIGKYPSGVWKLQVSYTTSGVSGTLNNWSLRLLSAAEPNVTSEADGDYVFTNLAVGAHHIREVPQAGFSQTSPAGGVYDITLATGMNLVDQDFGNLGSTVSGKVFSDDNNNGTLDDGETGLAGWIVYDDLNDNGTIDFPAQWNLPSTDVPNTIADQTTLVSTTTVSGLSGNILDLNVNLTINHTRDSNLTVTLIGPDNTAVTLISHNGANGANFLDTTLDDQASTAIASGTAPFASSFRPTGVLSAFNGKNANGTWRLVVADTVAGDSGTLNSWSLQISTNSLEPNTLSADDGSYSLTDLIDGTHHIREFNTGDNNYVATSPAGGAYDVPISSQSNTPNQNFGNHPPSISGTVFADANQDGMLDAGESGLAGWTVYDDQNDDGILEQTAQVNVASPDVPQAIPDLSSITSSTTVSGLFSTISNVTVTVSIQHPSDTDLVITLISPQGTSVVLYQNSGSGANLTDTTFDDSASGPVSGGAAPFTGSFQPIDPLATFDGEGLNGLWQLQVTDDIQFSSGTLLNWTLHLSAAGEPSTTTAADGSYSFANVDLGTHHIREIPAVGYLETSPAGGVYDEDAEIGSFITGQNFGNVPGISATPGAPLLLPVSDTGTFADDDVTRLNNASLSTALDFQVPGTVPGATVSLFADGTLLGDAIASDTTTTIITDGSTLLADGVHLITASQTEAGKAISDISAALSIQIDTVTPVASIAPVVPNPQTSPLAQMTISFTKPVSGLDLTDLQLTHDGGPNLLSDLQSVSSADNGSTWTLGDLTALTSSPGQYQLDLILTGTPILDRAGNRVGNSASSAFVVDLNPPVMDLNGDAAGTGYTATWTKSGAVSIADPANATLSDVDSTNLAWLSATLVAPQAGDVLAANTSGTSISAGFDGTTLSLTGSDTVAHYQQVLRTITYDNSGGPNTTSLSVNLVASDGAHASTPSVATIQIVDATIAARKLFYNNSKYDGNDPAINAADDGASDSAKVAYLPGTGTATYASVSSYMRGINGIFVDIAGPHGVITAADFIFRVGNNNSPSTWSAAAPPSAVSVRAGAGAGGSDRVEITWSDNAIQKTWLEVTVRGDDASGGENVNTGLAASDVFFWGSALADSGDGDDGAFVTSAIDELDARNHPASTFNNIPVSNLYDFNRDGRVDASDELAARNNATSRFSAPKVIDIGNPPSAPDAAPQAASPADTGVASGLADAAPSSASAPLALPPIVRSAQQTIDGNPNFNDRLDGETAASWLRGSRGRAILAEVERIASDAGLDDELFAALLSHPKPS